MRREFLYEIFNINLVAHNFFHLTYIDIFENLIFISLRLFPNFYKI